MPVRSVIQIDVDDDQFKAFMKNWEKYGDALKKQPAQWEKVNEAITNALGSGQAISAEHEKQAKLLDRQKTQWDTVKKSIDNVVSSTTRITKNVAETTLGLLKWAGIGGILSGLVGGGGLFGLDKLAQGVSNARRTSMGLGISSGEQIAANLNLGQNLNVNSILESIANARTDPSQMGQFFRMGINPTGQSTTQLFPEILRRAHEVSEAHGGSALDYQYRGFSQFMSQDEFRLLGTMKGRELDQHIAGMNRDAKNVGFNDDTMRQWQDFVISLERAGLTIRKVLVDDLTPLAGPLGQLSHSVGEAVQTFLKSDQLKKWIPELGDGIKALAEQVTKPEFEKSMKDFVDGIGQLAEKIGSALKLLGIVKDDKHPLRERQVDTTNVHGMGIFQNVTGALKHPFGGENNNPKNVRIKAAMDYFTSQGWTKAQAAGIVANLDAESGVQANPFGWNDGGKAFGMGQWHEDRQAAFKAKFKHDIRESTWKEQLEFVQYELREGARKAAGNRLKGAQDANSAGFIVSKYYEGPAGGNQEAAARGAAAARIQVNVNNNTGGNAAVTAGQVAAGAGA